MPTMKVLNCSCFYCNSWYCEKVLSNAIDVAVIAVVMQLWRPLKLYIVNCTLEPGQQL